MNGYSFDIWGTLIKSDPGYRPAWNKAIYDLFGLGIHYPSITRETFAEAFVWADRGADALTEMDGSNADVRRRLNIAFDLLGVTALSTHDTGKIGAVRAIQDDLVARYHPLPTEDRAPQYLTAMASTATLCYASNTGTMDGRRLRGVLEHLGYPDVDGVFSDEINCSKPDARFFEAVTSRLGNADRLFHVGDNPIADGIGAQRAGMTYVRCERSGNTVIKALEGVL